MNIERTISKILKQKHKKYKNSYMEGLLRYQTVVS